MESEPPDGTHGNGLTTAVRRERKRIRQKRGEPPKSRPFYAAIDTARHETPPDAGDGAGTVEETRDDRPACPKCDAPSEPVLTLPKRPGEDP